MGFVFTHYEAWEVLKDHPKWVPKPFNQKDAFVWPMTLNNWTSHFEIIQYHILLENQGLPRVKGVQRDLRQVEKLSRKWSKKSCDKNMLENLILSKLKRNLRNWSFLFLTPRRWGRKMRLGIEKIKDILAQISICRIVVFKIRRIILYF